MKCLTCQKTMFEIVDDLDFTRLGALPGKAVTLRDITHHQCQDCGPTSAYVTIWRLGPLMRELEAAKMLRVKHLWCTFQDNEWVIGFEPTRAKTSSVPRRKKRGG